MKARIPSAVIEKARAMRNTGLSLMHIAHTLGYSCEGIRLGLDPSYRESRNDYARGRRNKSRRAAGKPEARYAMPPHVPPEVLAERDATLNCAMSLTARVFGDPPPGRSALDMRGK